MAGVQSEHIVQQLLLVQLKMQQELLQMQQQLLQMQQEMRLQLHLIQQQLTGFEDRMMARLFNVQGSLGAPLMWPNVPEQQAGPANAPVSKSHVLAARGARIDELLAVYDLSRAGTVLARKKRLLMHLGVRA